MKLPRVRFTVRRMMVAVAIVAILVAYTERWRRYKGRAEFHRMRSVLEVWEQARASGAGCVVYKTTPSGHDIKAEQCERAALYPWLSVAPDPPEPK